MSDAPNAAVEVRGLTKRYLGVQALRGVDLSVAPGEIYGLVGANGAGKSTLIRILAGVIHPDGGEILVDGQPVTIDGPLQASALGLSFIHQELSLIPRFSAIQNIMLGLPKASRFGIVQGKALYETAREAADRVGIDFPLTVPVETRSVAERWLVAIARALVRKARLVAMDEPTASLSIAESQRLFKIVRDLAQAGTSVIYVTHRLDEILQLCSRVTVLKDGAVVTTMSREGASREVLVRAIVGQEPVIPQSAGTSSRPGERPVVLRVTELRRPPAVQGVSFELFEGEVLGIAGLVGSGRSETARLLFGADGTVGGSMELDGQPYAPSSTSAAVRRGFALVPEERRSQGLFLDKTTGFNLNITSLSALRFSAALPLISPARSRKRAVEIIKSLGVTPSSPDVPVRAMSGGNQQKVVMGKWLRRPVRVLVLDEPTRGVDVGARAEIHRIIRQLADDGRGVIVISSEFEELLGCDRVIVLSEGRVVGVLPGPGVTEGAILKLCYAGPAETSLKPTIASA